MSENDDNNYNEENDVNNENEDFSIPMQLSYSFSQVYVPNRNNVFEGLNLLLNMAEAARIAEIMETVQMSAAMQESMDSYKCQEKKPEIRLNLKSRKFKDGMQYNKCMICLEEYKIDDDVSKLKCKHLFHHTCIMEWGMYKQECPVCKKCIAHKINESIKT